MKSALIALATVLLPGGTVSGQGLLRTLNTFREDFGGLIPLFPAIENKRVTYSCFRVRHGIFANYHVRYTFQKAPRERDMPCVAITVDIPSDDHRGKNFVRQKLLNHAKETWGPAAVKRGGFGVPGKTVIEYGLKDSTVTCFRIIEEKLKRPDLPGLTRFTVEAENYKPSLFNKARIK